MLVNCTDYRINVLIYLQLDLTLAKKLLVNDKIHASCPKNSSPEHQTFQAKTNEL